MTASTTDGPPAGENGAAPAATNGSSETVRNALLAGITTLLGALTAIEAVNGTVAQMIRNNFWPTIIALFLEAFAILVALFSGWALACGQWSERSQRATDPASQTGPA
jgi:hypothetical protein